MKNLNVCLILCLALLSSINSFQFSSLLEVQELKSNIFGSNLIETIALTFQSDNKVGAANEVLTMLQELKTQLTTDQTNDTDTFESKNEEFNNHIVKLEKEISRLTVEIDALIVEIQRLTDLITQADLNILSFKARIANLKTLLVEMKDANDKDNTYYKEKIAQLGKVYEAFSAILARLENLVGSVSAKQAPGHVNLTDSEKRDVEWTKNNPNVTAPNLDAKSFLQVESESTEMTNMMMQLSAQYDNFLETTLNADQGALVQLKKILSTIQEEILVQKTSAERHLDDINSKYKDLKYQADEEIALNETALKKQADNRDKYAEDKAARVEEKSNKEKRRELLRNEKELNEKIRASLKSTFEKEKIDRAAELDVVDKLIKIVENRLVKKSF